MKRGLGNMEFVLFKKIIDEIKGYNKKVWLHDFGEFEFNKDFDKFIDYCADSGIKPMLSSNATILTDEISKRILYSKLDKLILCMDGATKETYEKYRKGGDFERTRKNIRGFLEMKKSMGKTTPFTAVQIIRMKETEGEIDSFRKDWEGLADEILVKNFSNWAGQVDGASLSVSETSTKYKRRPCSLLWRNVVILWNGDVVLCCNDYDGRLVIGNVNESTLNEIWNNKRMKELRKQQSRGQYNNGMCDMCTTYSNGVLNAETIFNYVRQKME